MNNDDLLNAEKNVDYVNPSEGTPEGAENFSMKAQRDKFLGGTTNELKSPYAIAFMERAQRKIPENVGGMNVILEDIDRQAVENFGLFKPEKFPGTEISYVKLSVTPDLVRKIAATGETKQDQPPVEKEETDEGEAKNEVAFLFTAMGKPPDGNAYTAEDMGIDRFIRFIPRVARAMKDKNQIPNIDIYLMGAGTGYGEKASQELVDEIKKRGLDVRGEIYSEFVQKILNGKDLDQTRVLLQGVSMGTTTADKTFSQLPDQIKRVTHRLFDNPAGTHSPSLLNKWRGLQATIGLGAEFIQKEGFNSVAKTLGRTKDSFVEYLFKQKGLKPDTPSEKKTKDDLFKAAGFKLLTGMPLNVGTQEDTDETRWTKRRPYIRRGLYDPLTTTPARIAEITRRQGTPIETHSGNESTIKVPMKKKGRALEVPFKGTHFFMYENFDRFNQIINYCKTIPSAPSS